MLIISRTEIAFKEITNSKLFLWLVNLKIFLSNKEILVLYKRHFDKKKSECNIINVQMVNSL